MQLQREDVNYWVCIIRYNQGSENRYSEKKFHTIPPRDVYGVQAGLHQRVCGKTFRAVLAH